MNFQIFIRSLLGTFLCIALFSDCRKTDNFSEVPSSFSDNTTFRQLTLGAAKSSFEAQKARLATSRQDSVSASITDYLANVKLDWDYADTVMYQGNTPILRVPVAGAVYRYQNACMVFFLNDQGVVDSRLMVVTTDSSYNATTQFSQKFDGSVVQFTWSGEMVHSYRIDDGVMNASIKLAVSGRNEAVDCPPGQVLVIYINDPTRLSYCIEVGTPSSGGGGFGFPGNPNDGGNGGGGNPIGGGGGGNGSISNNVFDNHINNYFNPNDFDGFAKKNAILVNRLKDRFGLFNASNDLLNSIINDCNLPGEDDPEGLHGALVEYVNGPVLPCVQTIITNDRADFFNAMYSINVTSTQIQALSTAGININSNTFIAFFTTLGLTSVQAEWLINNPDALAGVMQFNQQVPFTEDQGQSTVQSVIEHIVSNNITPSQIGHIANVPPPSSVACIPCYTTAISLEYAILKVQQPNANKYWLYAQAVWSTLSSDIHTAMDIAGMVPGAGEVFDLANGTLYAIEGDYVNSATSYAASLPFVGWVSTGAKYARKIVNAGGNTMSLRYIVDASGKISFGSRSQLRTVMKTPSGHQAHHVIPWEHRDHPVIQMAANNASSNAFHLNDALNGLNVSLTRHNGSHPAYNQLLESKLDDILNDLQSQGKFNPTDALSKVQQLANNAKNAINASPNLPINSITF